MRIFTVDDFFRTLGKIIDISWGNHWGTFLSAFPVSMDDNELPLPMITCRLSAKRPAKMGSASEIKPRIRSEHKDPNDPRNLISIYGQRFECIVELTVWTDNPEQLSSISTNLEDMMLSYAGIFKENGVVDIIYLQTTDDIPVVSNRVSTTAATLSRTIVYNIVLDKLTPVSQRSIEEVKIKLASGDDVYDKK